LKGFLVKIDPFRVLPLWTFFAPNPGVSDYHLLYRTRNGKGDISSFINIRLRNKKNFMNAIWNPPKRSQKALNDFAQEIKRQIAVHNLDDESQHLLKLSLSYIAILHYCTEINRGASDTESVQFMILESFGYFELAEPRLVLNSDFHQI
jgi:hypothetical protein